MAVDNITLQTVNTTDRLSFSLFIATVLHAIFILGVSFNINPDRKASAPTLEITLASYKSQKKPDQADYLAQFNQEASGTEETAKELTSQREAEIADTRINEITPPPQQRTTETSERRTKRITTFNESSHQAQRDTEREKDELEQRKAKDEDIPAVTTEIASLHAKLDQQRQAYAKRPRIRRLTSVSTKASHDAEYLHNWSTKVEYIGNNNYPEEALRDKVYGDLRLAAVVLPNGTVDRVEILKSSGFRVLDDAARQIVHLASPFAPFPPEIRKDVDKLEIIRTWRFEITGLKTSR